MVCQLVVDERIPYLCVCNSHKEKKPASIGRHVVCFNGRTLLCNMNVQKQLNDPLIHVSTTFAMNLHARSCLAQLQWVVCTVTTMHACVPLTHSYVRSEAIAINIADIYCWLCNYTECLFFCSISEKRVDFHGSDLDVGAAWEQGCLCFFSPSPPPKAFLRSWKRLNALRREPT